MKSIRKLLALVFVIFFQCQKDKNLQKVEEQLNDVAAEVKQPKLFEFLSPEDTNITFRNTLNETETFNFLLYEYLYNGGGVALGDINNDGLLDIYFTGNAVKNKLYLNNGNFKFIDITEQAGVDGGLGLSTGVNMADVNNDGYLDIYICKSAIPDPQYRQNVLYLNNGDLTFTESAKKFGINDSGFSVQAYFFDMDGDNDLDVYVLNHPSDMREAGSLLITQNEKGELEIAKPKSFKHISDRLYENKGNNFVDISKESGILNVAFGLSAVIADFNNDFLPDIYVCNDYIMPDRLLINSGKKTFEDRIHEYFRHTSFSSMGSDFADINNDEYLDLMTLDMAPRQNFRRKMLMATQNYDKFEKMVAFDYGAQYALNTLQLNSGIKHFTDIAFVDNLAQTDWSWSVLMADFDNNGNKDIHITNGYNRDITNNDYSKFNMNIQQQRFNAGEITFLDWIESIPRNASSSYLFKNKGQANFEDVSNSWNSGPPAFSNGSAYGDLNNDGYLDLVVNNINNYPFIMKNTGLDSFKNNYLSIVFETKKNNTYLGTKTKLYLANGEVQTEVLYPTRGFLSSSQHRLHFGIEKGAVVEKIEVIWPDKSLQTIINPKLNQILRIDKAPDDKFQIEKPSELLLIDVSNTLPKSMAHKENDFIDFKREPLLHHKLSEEGPGIAVGDVNGDGLEDVFVGGAVGIASKLFFQNSTGTFDLQKTIEFERDKNFEDVDALFFDVNGDNMQDLYVVSGGNSFKNQSEQYQDRIYVNDGSGNLIRQLDALPSFRVNGSVVKANDIDGDGLLDLFVGSRSIPGRYPEAENSYLLKNIDGKFVDVTSSWSKNLKNIGLITDASFADLNNDGINELIVCGEWIPISVFEIQNGVFVNKTKEFGLNDKIGWWSSILVKDINDDNYADIVGGNLGMNSFYKATNKEPIELYYKDFDRNGSLDAVLCSYIDGISYPVDGRDRLLDQMVMLKKRFTRYEPYARATIGTIFTYEELSDVKILKANHLEHTLFINQNGKSFESTILPREAQFSIQQSAIALDINKDEKLDIITGGNFYGTDAEFGRYDASIGSVLINQNNEYNVLSVLESGLNIYGNVREIVPITIGNREHLLIVRNNDKFSLYKIND